MASTIPQPPAQPADLGAEYQRLYELVCDQGDAIAGALTVLARLKADNRASHDLLILLGAGPPGLRVVRDT